MVLEDARRLVHFEVHVQRGARWTIELTAAEEELACERARQFLQRADVDGIKVWKEVYQPASGQSAGRIVLAETRPRLKGRWRFGRWTAVVDDAATEPEPEELCAPQRGAAAAAAHRLAGRDLQHRRRLRGAGGAGGAGGARLSRHRLDALVRSTGSGIQEHPLQRPGRAAGALAASAGVGVAVAPRRSRRRPPARSRRRPAPA